MREGLKTHTECIQKLHRTHEMTRTNCNEFNDVKTFFFTFYCNLKLSGKLNNNNYNFRHGSYKITQG